VCGHALTCSINAGVKTEEIINYKDSFWQPHQVPSQHGLPLSYTAAVLTILWPFTLIILKNLPPASFVI
jgi:hypothetical protein